MGNRLFVQVRQGGGHTVQIGLGPDQAVVGQQVGAIEQMLARAHADLQVERAVLAEQPFGSDRALGGHRHLRQEFVHQPLLVIAQLLALGTAIETTDLKRIGHGQAH